MLDFKDMKFSRKNILSDLLAFSIITTPVLIFAAGTGDIGLQNPIGVNSISELVLIVVRVVRYILIPFVVIAIMYAGWQYIWDSYQGKVTKATHDTLKYILIGAFIVLSAELIAEVISNTIKTLTN